MVKKCASVAEPDEDNEVSCELPKGHDGPHAAGWSPVGETFPHTNYRLTWEDNPAYVKPKRHRRTKAEIAEEKAFFERAAAAVVRAAETPSVATRLARGWVIESLPEPAWIIV